MTKKQKRSKYMLLSVLSVATFLLFWYLLTSVLHVTSETTLPGPDVVLRTFFQKFTDKAPDGATMVQHIGSSVQITLIGYFLGCLVGVPLGIAMAWYKPVDLFVRPLFDVLKPIPGIAWVPLFIVFFGIGIFSKVAVIFISVLISVVINSYAGIKQTKDVHLWVGQCFGATRQQMLFRIAIPTALPYIMTGLRIALSAGWLSIVGAEMLGATKGLGFMIQQARGIQRPDVIIAGMIAIAIIGSLLSWVLGKIESKVVKGRGN